MAGYNHYTPLSDGSYRRSTVPDGQRRSAQRPVPPSPAPAPTAQQRKQEQHPQPKEDPPVPPKQEIQPPCPQALPQSGESILSFLKGLLPRQIDAADLLVISLLLLMNREDGEDGMSPLLTIALYFLL